MSLPLLPHLVLHLPLVLLLPRNKTNTPSSHQLDPNLQLNPGFRNLPSDLLFLEAVLRLRLPGHRCHLSSTAALNGKLRELQRFKGCGTTCGPWCLLPSLLW